MEVSESSSSHPTNQNAYANLLASSDEQVMQALHAGNTDAFAVIFKRYHRLIHVTALRILRDAGEAEDLTQNVFLEIYRRANQFDPSRGTLRVWLLQYAYSRSVNRRNYLLVRQTYNQSELTAADEAESLWSPARMQRQETVHLTSEVLAVLPEEQRDTIRMFFFEGLTLREIAERRKETFSNIRHHYYRGLGRLRSCLEARGGTEGATESVAPLGGAKRVET
jgi:RNA polymerase sigma-70 factor (ECF subfamily)